MRTFASSSFLFFVSFAVSVTAAPGQTRPNWVCAEPAPLGHNQVWHKELAHDFRAKYAVSSGPVGQGDCTRSVFWNAWNGVRKVTKNTQIPQDGMLSRTPTPTAGRGNYICDHVLELNMIKRIMEQVGGVCDVAQQMWLRGGANRTAALAGIKDIRTALNVQSNLFMLEKPVENRKGSVVHDPGPFATMSYFDISEIHDFLNVHGPGIQSMRTARALDGKVLTNFPDAVIGEKVQGIWKAYTNQVKAYYLIIKRQAEQKKKTDQCSGSPAPSSPRKRDVTPRLSKKHLHNIKFSGGIDSSLTRRGPRASAPRSGPHAPPGASCPLKNAPPKKVVNKDAAKTKPKPATKPRAPAKRPQPRPRNAKKQTVKRPATRARRAPGKQAPRKRTTPRRKPKTVPKPTRRPKGKPRTRRRK